MVFSPANTSFGAGADRTIPEVYDIIDAFTLTSFVMNSGNTIKSDGSFGIYNYQFLVLEYFKSWFYLALRKCKIDSFQLIQYWFI